MKENQNTEWKESWRVPLPALREAVLNAGVDRSSRGGGVWVALAAETWHAR